MTGSACNKCLFEQWIKMLAGSILHFTVLVFFVLFLFFKCSTLLCKMPFHFDEQPSCPSCTTAADGAPASLVLRAISSLCSLS